MVAGLETERERLEKEALRDIVKKNIARVKRVRRLYRWRKGLFLLRRICVVLGASALGEGIILLVAAAFLRWR